MTDGTRLNVSLSAALGAGDRARVRRVLEEAAAGGAPRRPVEEALLQAYLFVGFPPVLEAFTVWREIRPPEEEPAAAGGDPRGDRRVLRDGRATCRRVYGHAYDLLRSNVVDLHPDLDRWMVREGYGKVLSRPGLDLCERELCIVALLVAARWPRQLHSHLRGALRVGAGEEAVSDALEAGLEAERRRVGRASRPGWEERARELWAEVRERHRGTDGEPAS